MASIERKDIKGIRVLPLGQIWVKTEIVKEQDGKVISKIIHRHVVDPDADAANEEQSVRDVARSAHTPAIKQAWADLKASQAV